MKNQFLTDYDKKISNNTLEMIKSLIPYINHGNTIGIFIKFMELKNALSMPDNTGNSSFEDIKNVLSKDEKFKDIFDMFDLMEMFNNPEMNSDMFNNMGDMFSNMGDLFNDK